MHAGWRLERTVDDLSHLGAKTLAPESPGVLARRLPVKAQPLETLDRRRQPGGALLAEQHAGAPVEHGLRRSPDAVGDHRNPGRLGLYGHDAKVLLAGKQKRARAAQKLISLGLGDPAEELGVPRRARPHRLERTPTAGHLERSAQARASGRG